MWGFGWTMNTMDLRKASVLVPGQEVLTADNVALKLSLLVTHQVADPVKAAHETQNWSSDVYNAAQLALRAVIGAVTVEARPLAEASTLEVRLTLGLMAAGMAYMFLAMLVGM